MSEKLMVREARSGLARRTQCERGPAQVRRRLTNDQ